MITSLNSELRLAPFVLETRELFENSSNRRGLMNAGDDDQLEPSSAIGRGVKRSNGDTHLVFHANFADKRHNFIARG